MRVSSGAARSWQCLTSRERAPEWYAEGCVGKDQLVARTDGGEHRAPLVDHFANGLTIRGTDIGDARGDLHRALRIDEDGLTARRQLPLGGIHEVQHGDVMANGPESTDGALDLGDVHEQIRNEDDHAATIDEACGLLERSRCRGSAAGPGFFEGRDNASPLPVSGAWWHGAPDLRVESHQPDGVALPEQ